MSDHSSTVDIHTATKSSFVVSRWSVVVSASLMVGCLGNSPSGNRDYLYALVVDPVQTGESGFVERLGLCRQFACSVRVEIVDLTDHSRVGSFTVPSTANAHENNAPTGFASSLAVSSTGEHIYVGGRLEERVRRFDANGNQTGLANVFTGLAGPVDMVLSPDDAYLYVHDGRGILRVETATMHHSDYFSLGPDFPTKFLGHKIALSADGSTLAFARAGGGDEATLHLVDTATMSAVSLGGFPMPLSPNCFDPIKHDLLATPDQRLVLLGSPCNEIHQFSLKHQIYLLGWKIDFGPTGRLYDHFDYSGATQNVYATRNNNSLGNVAIASVLLATEKLGDAWIGSNYVTDVVANADGTAVYYALRRDASTRLGVVQTALEIVADDAYTFATAFPNQGPLVTEMQIVRHRLVTLEEVGNDPTLNGISTSGAERGGRRPLSSAKERYARR